MDPSLTEKKLNPSEIRGLAQKSHGWHFHRAEKEKKNLWFMLKNKNKIQKPYKGLEVELRLVVLLMNHPPLKIIKRLPSP